MRTTLSSAKTLISNLKNSRSHLESAQTVDFIQQKLISNMNNKRPFSNSTNFATRRNSEISLGRSLVSQIDPKVDKSLHSYKISTAVLTNKRVKDSQKLEDVIMARMNAGFRQENELQQKAEFPDYNANYCPKLTLRTTKKLTKQQEKVGTKLTKELNHRFFAAGMAPDARPQVKGINELRSIMTDELDKASSDMAIKIHQMKMIAQGFSLEALETDHAIQKTYIAFGDTHTLPKTISDHVRVLDAEKFQGQLNHESVLRKKEFKRQNVEQKTNWE
uniref:Uncharacterized protein n=1 Tax=Trepomonas sp. PC1 TaxID=1076344 RepID=A0A146KGT0_9EUKA|eukprot:JAP94845.1 hypothetical protein TPC1_12354 [Trepomonas sp. PC1]